MSNQMVMSDFPTNSSAAEPRSVVYIVRIGKFVKIGFSTNLPARLDTFRALVPDARLLLAKPGDRTLEKRLHLLLSEHRIVREMFHDEWRVHLFIDHVEYDGLQRGLDFLESSTPQKRAEKKRSDREKRVHHNRTEKAELDAYYASLVAERKERLGW